VVSSLHIFEPKLCTYFSSPQFALHDLLHRPIAASLKHLQYNAQMVKIVPTCLEPEVLRVKKACFSKKNFQFIFYQYPIFSSYPSLCFPYKIPFALLILPVCATCPAHITLFLAYFPKMKVVTSLSVCLSLYPCVPH
jgi:hypothetical protein